jgi:hypothetical protein
MTDDLEPAARWRFDRSVERLRVVDDIVGKYATTYCGHPFRRREVPDTGTDGRGSGVVWTIDGDIVVEYLHGDTGPGRLVVREISLLAPLRRAVRTRHVTISYAGE